MPLTLREYQEFGRLSRIARRRGTTEFLEDMSDIIGRGQIKLQDVSIRSLFEHLVEDGYEMLRGWGPECHVSEHRQSFMEADAISSSDFANVNGQIFYNAILEIYNKEAAIFTPLIPTVNTNLNGEKIAGIGGLGDKAEIVEEKGLYPEIGVSEDWVWSPETDKRGFIVSLTREAIYFNKIPDFERQASNVGEYMGINREKRAIDCIIDENTTKHRYNRKNRGPIATYGDNSGSHDFDNLQGSNALADWTDVDLAEQLLFAMTDPNDGEPISLSGPAKLICARGLAITADRIRNATEVRHGTDPITISPNPVAAKFDVLTSAQFGNRLATDTSWFYGDPSRAFKYMQNFPLQVETAPPDATAAFERDIVVRYKASERGQYVTVDPRYMVKCTN